MKQTELVAQQTAAEVHGEPPVRGNPASQWSDFRGGSSRSCAANSPTTRSKGLCRGAR